MEFLANTWYFFVVLTVVVFVHELGHYSVARWNGVKVDVFSIGFGPEIFGFTTKTGTRWKFSLLPLGGYVKMFGDADAASATGDDRPMTEEEKAVSFRHKRVGQRAAIVFAGPAANFVFAIVVQAILFMALGQSVIDPVIGSVEPNSAASEAGLLPGDRVLSINGEKVKRYTDIDRAVALSAAQPLEILYQRGEIQTTVTVTPKVVEHPSNFGGLEKFPTLGIAQDMEPIIGGVTAADSPAGLAGLAAGDRVLAINGTEIRQFPDIGRIVRAVGETPTTVIYEREGKQGSVTLTPKRVGDKLLMGIRNAPSKKAVVRHNPMSAVVESLRETGIMISSTFIGIGQMITGVRDSEELRGPFGIAQGAGEAAKIGLAAIVFYTVLLSLNLGLINLFPIPVLDGGHLVFYSIEAIRGRPVGEKAQEYSFMVGLFLVLTLMVYATRNDIVSSSFWVAITNFFS